MMIDLSYLKITTGDDKALIKELVGIFKGQLPELKKDITESFQSKNWKTLTDAAHKAKNSFQMMGITRYADELKSIEIMAREEKESPEIGKLIKSFADGCLLVIAEIEKLDL
jgi:HPt (histidine-containing phosphotransfer) domain-containing protein